jgi:hypothetical protein
LSLPPFLENQNAIYAASMVSALFSAALLSKSKNRQKAINGLGLSPAPNEA